MVGATIMMIGAEEKGISMQMIRVCKEIRKLAKLDRIQLDENIHSGVLNQHLYSYIEYCGMNIREYIKDCLSNVPPFMIVRFSSREPAESYICILDNRYQVSLYIKLDKTFGNEVIVSFLENNMIQNKTGWLVPVLAEEIRYLCRYSDKSRICII